MNPRVKALLQTAALSAVVSGVIVALIGFGRGFPSIAHLLGLFAWLWVVFLVGFGLMLGAHRK
jgi:hypothetical protein